MASWMKTFLFRCRITRMALDAQCDILVAHKETLWTCEISFNSNLLCIYKEVIAMLFGTPSQAHREWHPFRGEHERLSVKLWICNITCFFMASTKETFILVFEASNMRQAENDILMSYRKSKLKIYDKPNNSCCHLVIFSVLGPSVCVKLMKIFSLFSP